MFHVALWVGITSLAVLSCLGILKVDIWNYTWNELGFLVYKVFQMHLETKGIFCILNQFNFPCRNNKPMVKYGIGVEWQQYKAISYLTWVFSKGVILRDLRCPIEQSSFLAISLQFWNRLFLYLNIVCVILCSRFWGWAPDAKS